MRLAAYNRSRTIDAPRLNLSSRSDRFASGDVSRSVMLKNAGNRMAVRFGEPPHWPGPSDMVKVSGCRPARVAGLGVGRRTKTAQARTRGRAARVYGDFEFWPSAMMAAWGRRWRRQGRGE